MTQHTSIEAIALDDTALATVAGGDLLYDAWQAEAAGKSTESFSSPGGY